MKLVLALALWLLLFAFAFSFLAAGHATLESLLFAFASTLAFALAEALGLAIGFGRLCRSGVLWVWFALRFCFRFLFR